jgi:hypothetical protein
MQRLHGRIFMLEAGGSDGVKHCVWLKIALGDRGRIPGNSRGSWKYKPQKHAQRLPDHSGMV